MTTFHLVDASGKPWPIPKSFTPDALSPRDAAFSLARGYGWDDVVRFDDGRGAIKPLNLKGRMYADSGAQLSACLTALQAAVRSAVWLTSSTGAVLAVQGGYLIATPTEQGGERIADVVIQLAPANLTPHALDQSEVYS